MSETQEKVWVVVRGPAHALIDTQTKPVKVLDDRADAREYVRKMNAKSRRHFYRYYGVKKG